MKIIAKFTNAETTALEAAISLMEHEADSLSGYEDDKKRAQELYAQAATLKALLLQMRSSSQ